VSAVETAIEHGNPYRGIHSYVEEHDIDLVVMGTHGRSGIERYLLGSVAEKTVRTSPVPVRPFVGQSEPAVRNLLWTVSQVVSTILNTDSVLNRLSGHRTPCFCTRH